MDQAELLSRLTSDPAAVEHARRHRETVDASEARDTAALRDHVSSLKKGAAKVEMSSVGYLDQSPYLDRCCTSCVMFRESAAGKFLGSCTLVDGDINPHGWCRRYTSEDR